MPKQLILASASPRRRELLSLLRLPFEVIVSDVDEDIEGESPREIARILADRKAEAIAHNVDCRACIIVGADTVVSIDAVDPPISLAKPSDSHAAFEMLRLLSGRTHTVHTGLACIETLGQGSVPEWRRLSKVVDTQVTFRELTDAMIQAYIATGEPFDKAGGYGIQGYASTFVEAIHGDYFNVVGLPVATVARMLEELGIEWWRGPEALD